MLAFPAAILLAAIWADRQEAPPSKYGDDGKSPRWGDLTAAATWFQAAAGRRIGHDNVSLEISGPDLIKVTAQISPHDREAAKFIHEQAERISKELGINLVSPFPDGRFRLWKKALDPLPSRIVPATWAFIKKGAYGALSRHEMVSDYGALSRHEMVSGYGALSRHEMVSDYGALSRHEMVSDFGALSRHEMVTGYGAEPGSWQAAWNGTRYGGTPTMQQLEEINSRAMKIIKKILGWGVATKGPKLVSLNSQRDAMIKQGVSPHDPRVLQLEKQALDILIKAGMRVGSAEHNAIEQLGAQRDQLMMQASRGA